MKIAIPILLMLAAASAQVSSLRAETADTMLGEEATLRLLFKKLKLAPEDASIPLMRKILATRMRELKNKHDPPYSKEEVLATLGEVSPLAEYDTRDKREKIPLVTEAILRVEEDITRNGKKERVVVGPGERDLLVHEEWKDGLKPPLQPWDEVRVYQGATGPFRLRRSMVDIRDGVDGAAAYGPDPKILEAKGAKISFSNNHLEDGGGAWNSEGALYLPILIKDSRGTAPSTTGFFPAISWKVEETQVQGKNDIDELKFSAPFYHKRERKSAFGGEWVGILEPFYQTDTDLDGAIWGSEASLAYIRNFDLPGLGRTGVNKWLFIGEKNETSYKVRALGLLDYSETHTTSPYSNRQKGDDWLRWGMDTGLEVGLFRKEDQTEGEGTIALDVSYKFMSTLAGDGGWSDLFSTSLTYWLSDYAGLSLEYQNGETPVADKEIDLITLGLELRY